MKDVKGVLDVLQTKLGAASAEVANHSVNTGVIEDALKLIVTANVAVKKRLFVKLPIR